MIILSLIFSIIVGRSSDESTLGKTVFIVNDEPTYFALDTLGKKLAADFKNNSLFVMVGLGMNNPTVGQHFWKNHWELFVHTSFHERYKVVLGKHRKTFKDKYIFLVIATSGRAIAQALKSSGDAIAVIDGFADLDTCAATEVCIKVARTKFGLNANEVLRAINKLQSRCFNLLFTVPIYAFFPK